MTEAERVAEFRRRMKDAGFRRLELYVHDNDRDTVKQYAVSLSDKRLRSIQPTE